MMNVEQVIREVAGVYQAMTGRPLQPGRAELPPEVEPLGHVENRYRQFKSILEAQARGVPQAAGVPAAMVPPAWTPPIDVVEHEREVRFEIDLPGISREAVTVSVVRDFLIVRGERPSRMGNGAAVRHQERAFGAFQRFLALPPRARRDGLEATLRDGVLTIVVPTDGPGTDATEIPVEVK